MEKVVFVIGLVFLSASLAVGATYFNGGGTNEWKTATNWSAGLPSSTNSGIIPNTTGLTCYIHDGAAVSMNAYVGYNNKAGTLSMDGGTLTVGSGSNTFSIGEGATGTFTLSGGGVTNNGSLFVGNYYGTTAGNGTLTMSNASTTLTTKNLFIANYAGSTGVFNMSGGTLTVGPGSGDFSIGKSGTGTFTLSGGSVTENGNLYLGGYTGAETGNGTLNITNGTLTISSQITIAQKAGSTGQLNLYGGTISINTASDSGFLLRYGTTPGTGNLDIKGTGTMTWLGNHVDQLTSYRTSGWIYTSQAGKTVNDISITYDGTKTTMQLVPEPATMTLLCLGMIGLLRRNK